MAISPLWPKPPRWPIQPGTIDPNQRWVWHTRPRFILPMWEHASAGAAQRYVRLGQTRRTARTWQLLGVLVTAVVVEDHVDHLARRDRGLDRVEETQELLV